MAIKEIRREWSACQLGYVKTFLCHREVDLADLPKCCEGSKAIVSETDNEYICTANGWVNSTELPEDGGNNSGGSGGGSGGGGVIYVEAPNFNSDQEIVCLCYEDAALTKPLNYETGAALLAAGARIAFGEPSMYYYLTPSLLMNVDEIRASMVMVFNSAKMSLWQVMLLFTDSTME